MVHRLQNQYNDYRDGGGIHKLFVAFHGLDEAVAADLKKKYEAPRPKMGTSSSGKPMHYSVGALIRRGDKYLLIDRNDIPYGFAGLAGHVDVGESPEEALEHEVPEEGGFRLISSRLLVEEEVLDNLCGRGIDIHYWYVFECEVEGEMVWNPEETKSIGWYTVEEIKQLTLEPVWEYWFHRLGII